MVSRSELWLPVTHFRVTALKRRQTTAHFFAGTDSRWTKHDLWCGPLEGDRTDGEILG
jgi:hypothetical protein